mmetsp:Transcript_8209/g.20748  ORF Transcript_8209/g.20748 Transcript_8209/m.20748 type:complete len:255 (-) Transcript_8209:516-1280(-)
MTHTIHPHVCMLCSHTMVTRSPLTTARSCSTSSMAASRASWMLMSKAALRSLSLTTSSARRARPLPDSARISAMPSATALRCRRSDALCPVRILSMSICPVLGSHAACCIATRISRIASVASRASTTWLSRMRAKLSLSRTRLSSCRGVAVMTLRLPPMRRMSTYPSTSISAASSDSTGAYFALAYEMYSVSRAASIAPLTALGGSLKCRDTRWRARRRSVSGLALSSTRKMRSKRDSSVGGSWMLSMTDMLGL